MLRKNPTPLAKRVVLPGRGDRQGTIGALEAAYVGARWDMGHGPQHGNRLTPQDFRLFVELLRECYDALPEEVDATNLFVSVTANSHLHPNAFGDSVGCVRGEIDFQFEALPELNGVVRAFVRTEDGYEKDTLESAGWIERGTSRPQVERGRGPWPLNRENPTFFNPPQWLVDNFKFQLRLISILPREVEWAFDHEMTPAGRNRASRAAVLRAFGDDEPPTENPRPKAHPPRVDTSYRLAHTSPGPESCSMMDVSTCMPDYYERPDYYFCGETPAEDYEASGIIQRARGRQGRTLTVYRAVPKEVKTINEGDWVAITRGYARQHARGETGWKVIKRRVRARDLYTNGDSHFEWGWHPPSEREDG